MDGDRLQPVRFRSRLFHDSSSRRLYRYKAPRRAQQLVSALGSANLSGARTAASCVVTERGASAAGASEAEQEQTTGTANRHPAQRDRLAASLEIQFHHFAMKPGYYVRIGRESNLRFFFTFIWQQIEHVP